MISWFCLWHKTDEHPQGVSDADRRGILALVRNCSGVESATWMVPSHNVDPHYQRQTGAPDLVLQLEFSSLSSLEHALNAGGPLAPLADGHLFPSLAGRPVFQEAMLSRKYPCGKAEGAKDEQIAYLVTYEGPAEDEQAWHAHYIDRHRVLLGKFPGLIALEIYTPATVVSRLPFEVQKSLQRNKTVFASLDTMRAAMLSDIRDELRSDFSAFPRSAGTGTHHAFAAAPLEN